MAKRPIFIPQAKGAFVHDENVEFTWHPGMSKNQKQRSVRSLHEAARKQIKNLQSEKILEISSKSDEPLGVELSAFNLFFEMPAGRKVPVEALFQGSKVFEHGGPYTDIYEKTSLRAKRDERLQNSGDLKEFRYEGVSWVLDPKFKTAFYDWLYLEALRQKENQRLAQELMEYGAFTDIEFNPKKSFSCQAHSAALYKAMKDRQLINSASFSKDEFLEILREHRKQGDIMPLLFPETRP